MTGATDTWFECTWIPLHLLIKLIFYCCNRFYTNSVGASMVAFLGQWFILFEKGPFSKTGSTGSWWTGSWIPLYLIASSGLKSFKAFKGSLYTISWDLLQTGREVIRTLTRW